MTTSGSEQEKSEVEQVRVEVILDIKSTASSIEPIQEWPSVMLAIPEINNKQAAFDAGKYHPGSGEICTKCIAQSDSSILRQPFLKYPANNDPGILKALLKPEEEVTYPDDGQELYLALCEEMNQCPVQIFYRSLLKNSIDVRYYCVNPDGVRAMGMALKFNKFVNVLNLADNFLNLDACFHLGEMLAVNSTLKELNISGCRIGPEGAKQLFAGLPKNKSLRILNLNKNMLGDSGVELFASTIFNGIYIQKVYLSYNKMGSKAALALAEALQCNNRLTHVDLSWNELYTPLGTCNLLNSLAYNENLLELNLSWNALAGNRIGSSIKAVMMAPLLRHLNLSNNRLEGAAIDSIIANMTNAKKIKKLNLSNNPMTPQDALSVLTQMSLETCKIQSLLMDNVCVNSKFKDLLKEIRKMPSKAKTTITHGEILGAYKVIKPDLRDIVLNRAEYLASSYKLFDIDIILKIMQSYKEKRNEMIDIKDFAIIVQYHGIHYTKILDNDLINAFADAFPGPIGPKTKMINIRLLVDYIRRKWPERKLPPTPPSEPEPDGNSVARKLQKRNGKGKKK